LAERFYHRAFKDVLAGADFFTAEVWDGYRYVLHDRETKFCASLRSVLAADGVKTMALPAGSQNLDACAERRVRSARSSACLIALPGEGPLSPTLADFSAHYDGERMPALVSASCLADSLELAELPNEVSLPRALTH
jgi:hypothetical protein